MPKGGEGGNAPNWQGESSGKGGNTTDSSSSNRPLPSKEWQERNQLVQDVARATGRSDIDPTTVSKADIPKRVATPTQKEYREAHEVEIYTSKGKWQKQDSMLIPAAGVVARSKARGEFTVDETKTGDRVVRPLSVREAEQRKAAIKIRGMPKQVAHPIGVYDVTHKQFIQTTEKAAAMMIAEDPTRFKKSTPQYFAFDTVKSSKGRDVTIIKGRKDDKGNFIGLGEVSPATMAKFPEKYGLGWKYEKQEPEKIIPAVPTPEEIKRGVKERSQEITTIKEKVIGKLENVSKEVTKDVKAPVQIGEGNVFRSQSELNKWDLMGWNPVNVQRSLKVSGAIQKYGGKISGAIGKSVYKSVKEMPTTNFGLSTVASSTYISDLANPDIEVPASGKFLQYSAEAVPEFGTLLAGGTAALPAFGGIHGKDTIPAMAAVGEAGLWQMGKATVENPVEMGVKAVVIGGVVKTIGKAKAKGATPKSIDVKQSGIIDVQKYSDKSLGSMDFDIKVVTKAGDTSVGTVKGGFVSKETGALSVFKTEITPIKYGEGGVVTTVGLPKKFVSSSVDLVLKKVGDYTLTVGKVTTKRAKTKGDKVTVVGDPSYSANIAITKSHLKGADNLFSYELSQTKAIGTGAKEIRGSRIGIESRFITKGKTEPWILERKYKAKEYKRLRVSKEKPLKGYEVADPKLKLDSWQITRTEAMEGKAPSKYVEFKVKPPSKVAENFRNALDKENFKKAMKNKKGQLSLLESETRLIPDAAVSVKGLEITFAEQLKRVEPSFKITPFKTVGRDLSVAPKSISIGVSKSDYGLTYLVSKQNRGVATAKDIGLGEIAANAERLVPKDAVGLGSISITKLRQEVIPKQTTRTTTTTTTSVPAFTIEKIPVTPPPFIIMPPLGAKSGRKKKKKKGTKHLTVRYNPIPQYKELSKKLFGGM